MIPVNKRKTVICILLSVFTFGFYQIYWKFLLIKNTRLIQNDESEYLKEALLLSFVPFYPLYWWFTRGKLVREKFTESGYTAKGGEILYLIFCIFGLEIVSMAIMQSDFNSIPSGSPQPVKQKAKDQIPSPEETELKTPLSALVTVTAALMIVFILFTLSLKIIDVQPVPRTQTPVGSVEPVQAVVGYATVNEAMFQLTGPNHEYQSYTDLIMGLSVLGAFGFAVFGLKMLIKRRSFKKVDYRILLLGAFYIVVIGVYVLFEHIEINYRPVGELELSYPSTHTMMTLCIIGTAILNFGWIIKNKIGRIIVQSLLGLVALYAVVARAISGVHWLTDIIGGVIISAALIMIYVTAVKAVEPHIKPEPLPEEPKKEYTAHPNPNMMKKNSGGMYNSKGKKKKKK